MSVETTLARMDADLFINGQWTEGKAGRLNNTDPGTGAAVGEVSLATAELTAGVGRSVETLRWNGEQAARIQATLYPGVAEGSRRLSIPTALGPVAVVTAWNFPAVRAPGRERGSSSSSSPRPACLTVWSTSSSATRRPSRSS